MRKYLTAVIMLFFASAAVNAQVFQAGTKELGFSFDFSSAKDLKTTNLNVDLGYHFTPDHQGSLLLQHSKLNDVKGGFLGFGYDYNILDYKKDIIPYLGGGFKIPMSDYKDIYDNVLFIHGGMKFFITQRTMIRVSLDLERYAGADNFDDSTAIALRAGYIVTFK